MNTVSLEDLANALRQSWSADTAFDASDWSVDNPARGQCAVSSLIVHDYFGGDLIRYAVTGDGIVETHHCNLLDDGVVLDTTASQYVFPVSMIRKPANLKGFASAREKLLADADTRRRYQMLHERVERHLSAHVT